MKNKCIYIISQEVVTLTLLLLPGDCRFRSTDCQTEKVHIFPFVHWHASGNVDDSSRNWKRQKKKDQALEKYLFLKIPPLFIPWCKSQHFPGDELSNHPCTMAEWTHSSSDTGIKPGPSWTWTECFSSCLTLTNCKHRVHSETETETTELRGGSWNFKCFFSKPLDLSLNFWFIMVVNVFILKHCILI